MKFKGTLLSEASGSIGGLCFSHNRGGQYIRQRVIPVNRNSIYQQAVRSYMTICAAAWNNVLTPAYRAGWDYYADVVKIPDPLGEPRNIGGLGMFCRSNVARLQAGLARVDAPPEVMALPAFTGPTISSIDESDAELELAFTATDDWANEVGGAMLVKVAAGRSASRNYFKGPYRYAGKISGAASPPSSPATLSLPLPAYADQLVGVEVRVCMADGRLSGTFRLSGTVSA